MPSEIHVGDVGVVLRVTILDQDELARDLSHATTINFIFEKPDGSLLTASGFFATDGTDGVIKYVFVSGDLDQSGTWKYQIFVAISPSQFYTDVGKLKIKNNLPI